VLEKRDETVSPKMKTTVTTVFVKGGPAPAVVGMTLIPRILIRHFNVTETNVDAVRSEDASPVEKREKTEKRAHIPGAIDGVNLNMAEGQVAELTFVETRAVGDDE